MRNTTARWPGGEVDRLERRQRGERVQEAAHRDGLAERHQLALDVVLDRADPRPPELAGVAHRVLQDGADQHRAVDRADGPGDGVVGVRVVGRVLVGGVLRPDDHGGRGRPARADPGGELPGRGRVIGGDGVGPEQVGQVPGARHVALDGGHLGRAGARGRAVDGQQRADQGQAGGAQQGGPGQHPPAAPAAPAARGRGLWRPALRRPARLRPSLRRSGGPRSGRRRAGPGGPEDEPGQAGTDQRDEEGEQVGPPTATHRSVGAPAWLITRRPHGKPP